MLEINKSKEYLYLAASLIALLTPAVYIIGIYYDAGHTFTYGLQQSDFPFTTADMFESAFNFAWVTLGAPSIHFLAEVSRNPIIILIIFLSLFLFFWLIVKFINNEEKLKNKFESFLDTTLRILHLKDNDVVISVKGAGVASWHIGKWFLIFLYFTIFWAGAPAMAFVKGKEQAKNQLDEYSSIGCNKEAVGWSICASVMSHKSGHEIAKGLLLKSNPERIALLSGDKLKIIKLTSDLYIERKYLGTK